MGAGQGRWSYKGLLLNRMANSELSFWDNNDDTNNINRSGSRTTIAREGDLVGLTAEDGDTLFLCFYSLFDPSNRDRRKIDMDFGRFVVSNDVRLFEQVFIKSLVLVLEDTSVSFLVHEVFETRGCINALLECIFY